MALKDSVDNVLERFGETITVTPNTAEVYSEDTGWSQTPGTSYDTIVVPYNYFSSRTSFRMPGNVELGDTTLVTKGDIIIAEKDEFVLEGKTYFVSEINPLKYQGVRVALIISGKNKL